MTTPEIVKFTIESFEGRLYTDDPVDTGGATKFGITRRTLAYYRGRPVTKQEVKDLTLGEAVAIGVQVFATEPRIDQIPDWRVRLAVYDYGFHSGHVRAIKSLQSSLHGLDQDGVIGPLTIIKCEAFGDHVKLAMRVLTSRQEFMQGIMERKPAQRRFMLGWWKRTSTLQRLIVG